MRWFPSPLAILLLVLTSLPGRAAPIAITNAGFENTSGQTVYNEFTFGLPTGWSLYDPAGIVAVPDVYTGTLEPNGSVFFPVGAPEGERVAILYNSGEKGAGAYGYFQTLGDTLQAGTQYTLTVQVGNITSGTAEDTTVYDLSNFPGYRVDLLADGIVIASDINTLTIAEGAWATSTVTFTSESSVQPGQELGIRLVNLNTTTGTPDNEVDFDDVRLSANAVPEPSTGMLLLGALVTTACLRRRRTA